MRTIKFRGQRAHTKEWVYGWLYHDQIFDGISSSQDVIVIRDECDGDYIVRPETVGQFTGLTDTNGKEIYEGDIVLINTYDYDEPSNCYTGTVEYGELSFCLVGEGSWGEKIMYIPIEDLKGSYLTEIEVIGNIHEGEI